MVYLNEYSTSICKNVYSVVGWIVLYVSYILLFYCVFQIQYILAVFLLLIVLLVTKRGVLKPLTVIVDLSISPFSSISFIKSIFLALLRYN